MLVQDDLNTYPPASLYEAFASAEAQRLAKRFEFHHTPKHRSWLDMAEIKLGILGRQCLSQRIDNVADLRRQVKTWEKDGDKAKVTMNWQFMVGNAQIKLKKLHPSLDE